MIGNKANKTAEELLDLRFRRVRSCTTECVSNPMNTLSDDEVSCFKRCVAKVPSESRK